MVKIFGEAKYVLVCIHYRIQTLIN